MLRGKVIGGVVVMEDPHALPEGTFVRVEAIEEQEESLSNLLLKYAGLGKGLPPDLARNHDHYLYGRPVCK